IDLTAIDVPGPAALAVPLARQRVEVARTTPVAVACDENVPLKAPFLEIDRAHVAPKYTSYTFETSLMTPNNTSAMAAIRETCTAPGASFPANTRNGSAAPPRRFMTPTGKSTAISAQQQPRQYHP